MIIYRETMSTIFINPVLSTDQPSIALQFNGNLEMSEDEFFDFCQLNKELRIERNALGEISILSPTGLNSGERELELQRQLGNWAREYDHGIAYGSSTGFTLSNGAVRSPNAAWVSHLRLKKMTASQLDKFAPVCPEFVIELKSASDQIGVLKAKMQEYMENGVLLGLLIIAEKKLVYKYQPKKPVQELKNKQKISCEPVLPGFELLVKEIW